VIRRDGFCTPHAAAAAASKNDTYIERHELRRPGVERQRGLALVDAVTGEHPPVLRAVRGRAPVPVPARRRGPRVEVVGVARGGDGARGKRGLPRGGDVRGRGYCLGGLGEVYGQQERRRSRRRGQREEERWHFAERVAGLARVVVSQAGTGEGWAVWLKRFGPLRYRLRASEAMGPFDIETERNV
jgi:hypothetical protein